MLHLLTQGIDRRGKKLFRLGAVAAINDIEGGLAAAVALLETDNVWPSDGDGTSTRGERGVGVDVGGRERGKSYYGPEDKMKNEWAHSKTVWAESQLRIR